MTQGELRILVAHNRYRQRGGEDAVVDAEIALLRRHGHQVQSFERDNRDIDTIGAPRLALGTLWSDDTAHRCRAALTDFRPDVIHVHNTFPLISPSIYWAAAQARVPVVQTLHNFRLLCPQAMLLRAGKICEDCVGRMPWPGVVHGCYHDSRLQSGVVAGMLGLHRTLRTWQHKVARYIALNEFSKRKFITGGLPADRISVKPNFVIPPAETKNVRVGGLFVGRLAPEKGIRTLLSALDLLPRAGMNIAGDGPESAHVAAHPKARWLGALAPDEVSRRMAQAAYLVLPSICYEQFGLVLVEAFACGLPVIASRLGALAELVDDGRTGMLFDPGNAADLAAKIGWAESHPDDMRRMGAAARADYAEKYTPDTNYRQLMDIYGDALTVAAASHEHA